MFSKSQIIFDKFTFQKFNNEWLINGVEVDSQ